MKEEVFEHLNKIDPKKYSQESDLASALSDYGLAISDSESEESEDEYSAESDSKREESDDESSDDLPIDPYCRLLFSELEKYTTADPKAMSDAYIFLFAKAPNLVCTDNDYVLAQKLWSERPGDAIKAYVLALKSAGNERDTVQTFFKDLSKALHFDDATQYMLSAKTPENFKQFDVLYGAAELVHAGYHKNDDPVVQGRLNGFLANISLHILTNNVDWTLEPQKIAVVLPRFVEFYTKHADRKFLKTLDSYRRWCFFSAAFCCALAQNDATMPLVAVDGLGLLEGIKPDFEAFSSADRLSDPRIYIRSHLKKAAWKQDSIALKNLRKLGPLMQNDTFSLFWATEISPWMSFKDFCKMADEKFVSEYRANYFANSEKSKEIFAQISDPKHKQEYFDLCAKDLDESFADWSDKPEEIEKLLPKVTHFYRGVYFDAKHQSKDLLGKLSEKSSYQFIRAAYHHAVGEKGPIKMLSIYGLDLGSKISPQYNDFDSPQILSSALLHHWRAAFWRFDEMARWNLSYLAQLAHNGAFKAHWAENVTRWVPLEDLAQGKNIHYVAARNVCAHYTPITAAAGLVALAGYAGYRLTR